MNPLHKALYHAICANPEDDTPRLVFADLLDETGNARNQLRAQFIRTQIALATQPLDSPQWVHARCGYPDITTGWLFADTLPKPLPPGFSWRHFEFRRGFPYAVGVDSLTRLSTSGTAIFDRAPIQGLQLRPPWDGSFSLLAQWPGLPRIRSLGLSGGWTCARAVAQLVEAPGAQPIRELQIHDNSLSPNGLQALAESAFFGQLTRFEMSHSHYPGALLVEALAAAREPGNLRHVAFAFCHLQGADITRFAQMAWLQTVEHLELTDQPLGPNGVRALANSPNLPRLRILNLSNTRPGRRGIQALGDSGRFRTLRMVDLSHNALGPATIKPLIAAEAETSLRVLNLANNPLGDTGVIALARSPCLKSLLELDLRNVNLHEKGAIALAESPFLENLQFLNLRSCDQPIWSEKARTALTERFGPRVWL